MKIFLRKRIISNHLIFHRASSLLIKKFEPGSQTVFGIGQSSRGVIPGAKIFPSEATLALVRVFLSFVRFARSKSVDAQLYRYSKMVGIWYVSFIKPRQRCCFGFFNGPTEIRKLWDF